MGNLVEPQGPVLQPDNPPKPRPFILCCCSPIIGHLMPTLQVAEHLVKQGHDVYFLASEGYRSLVDKSGANFLPHVGMVNIVSEIYLPTHYPEYFTMPPGIDKCAWVDEKGYVNFMPTGAESIRRALSHLRTLDASRQVVIVSETYFPGILPLKLGAELPEGYTSLPKTLGLSIIPAQWNSVDTGPTILALPPDSSEAGRTRNVLLAKLLNKGLKGIFDKTNDILRSICNTKEPLDPVYGEHAQRIEHSIIDSTFVCHDTILQMCLPAMEVPKSDWPANFKFGGTLPKRALPQGYVYPDWWKDILANSELPEADRKRIVVVTQGTVALTYTDMIIPTITGLANRSDVLVIAVLGRPGAVLGMQEVPANVRTADYLPYDAVLPYTDVFAAIGGYGSLQHAVSNGVPMVMAGDTEDKPQVALRGEVAGLAIKLRCGAPSPEVIAAAVDKMLADPSYKNRAMELKKEAEEFKALEVVERELLALVD